MLRGGRSGGVMAGGDDMADAGAGSGGSYGGGGSPGRGGRIGGGGESDLDEDIPF